MALAPMRTRASYILSILAVVQVILLGASLGLLILKLRQIREDLGRLGREEQTFLNDLADAESGLHRTSILLRDHLILKGDEQRRAGQELGDMLTRIANQPLRIPEWVSPEIRVRLDAVESDRREYMNRARMVTAWQERERTALGPLYLSRELTPMRERFMATTREIAALVGALRQSRNQARADAIDAIEALIVRILSVAGVFGLGLAGVATWRFRHFEKERDIHMQHLQEAEDGLRALSQRLVESQELERKKLSRELHDEIGQLLTAMRVQLGQIEPAGEASQAHLKRVSDLAERSLRTVREMARGLRPAMLDDLGLAPALKWLGRDFSKNTVLDVDVQIEGELAGLNDPTRTCLYRVVQEALTNCVKHSGAGSARVMLHESPSEIVLTVQDSGAGFVPGRSAGIGLLGMRERVEELGGDFAVVSAPGAGTMIRAKLPKTGMETT